jgi:nitronate monooxygenase
MSPLDRASRFCDRFGLRLPILLAPMAGACPPALSAAVANAGGLGGCGALTLSPAAIVRWATEVRAASNGGFQINLWIPDPPPARDRAHEAEVRAFLGHWGPEPTADAGEPRLQDFEAQCEAMIEAGPTIVSSIMGVYPPAVVERLKARGVRWFANATTVVEARVAEAAGADVIVAQGMEAGGHRGAFDAGRAQSDLVGLFALVPAIADAVQVPVVASGGIGDARGIAAALMLGASAVQIGTGFLRCPEADISPAWAEALAAAQPEDTTVTRAFSGRAGRSLATAYARAAADSGAPAPAPYPVQRGLTQAMRETAAASGDLDRMQAWAGQSARLARAEPAGELAQRWWLEARSLLGG